MTATFARFVRAVVDSLGWRLAGAAVIGLALAAIEGAGLLLLIPLLSSAGLAVDAGLTSGFARSVAAAFAVAGLRPTLITVLAVFLVISVIQAVLYRTYLLVNPTLEQRFVQALRNRLYAAVVKVEWSFFITKRTNDLVYGVTADVDRAGTAVFQLLNLFAGAAVSAVYIAVAFRLSPSLTVLVGAVGLIVLWTLRGRTRRSSELGEKYSEVNRRQFHMISESIASLKTAKSFGAERRDVVIFAEHARDRTAAYLELLRSYARSKMSVDLSTAAVICGLLYVAVEWLGLQGAGLLMLVYVFGRVMPRVMSLQESAQILFAGLPSFTAVMRLVDECEAHAERLPHTVPDPLPLLRDVRLDAVSYRYQGDAVPAVQALSLSIPAGRTTAFVGASGAGKSTLADLLIGLLRPATGRVLIDGRPLADADVSAWRRSTGYVPQESFLLHDTVRANLLWAKPDASDSEMWTALERAAAADFLRSRREGLDTIVGDRGVRVSGGERQRLALARALLTNPALLVLDEATSALDSINEQRILSAVRGLAGAVTTVIVTHRLSAIRHADYIHVMHEGRIAESGTWDELIARQGLFAGLLLTQSRVALHVAQPLT
ncbi:MAG: ABC transporter ATP-binding protein [Vicinamibacterales bacterium]